MDYDPLDEKPQIRFDKSDLAVIVLCLVVLMYFGAHVVLAMFK